MNCSEYLSKYLIKNNIKDVFSVTGGGSMFLNKAFHDNKKLKVTYFHHEQAAAFAAEGYWRSSGKIAAVCLTTGPGALNAITGIFGSYVDSVPILVISGQSKIDTNINFQKKFLRQLGDQEANISKIVSPFVKYISCPNSVKAFKKSIYKSFEILNTHRYGPVWLDVPIDIQSKNILDQSNPKYQSIEYINKNNRSSVFKANNKKIDKQISVLVSKIFKSKRPLILLGTGVKSSNLKNEILKISSKFNFPVVTGWNAHDLVPYEHKNYSGKPGTVGDRPGNFAVYNSDFILILGCRLNIRQISYNWNSFAPNAYQAMVDIDSSEMEKKTLNLDLKIHTDLESFIKIFKKKIRTKKKNKAHNSFLTFCKSLVIKYSYPVESISNKNKLINPYKFFYEFSKKLSENELVVLGNGSACVIGFQSIRPKKNQKIFTNSGSAPMGYDISASIGASISQKNQKKINCITGDGSIMLNLQELATIKYLKTPIKIFILNNGGYLSIQQTQKNFFKKDSFGTGNKDGLGFPDFEKVSKSFEIDYFKIKTIKDLKKYLTGKDYMSKSPSIIEIFVDQKQSFEPKLISWKDSSGALHTPMLHEMSPLISDTEMKLNIIE